MEHPEHSDDCLWCEVVWLATVGPAAEQLAAETQHYVDRQAAGLATFRESVQVTVRRG